MGSRLARSLVLGKVTVDTEPGQEEKEMPRRRVCISLVGGMRLNYVDRCFCFSSRLFGDFCARADVCLASGVR